MNEVVIRNEDDAIDILKKLLEGQEISPGFTLKLESWPRFVVHIKGVDFDGTIPTRIMPTLLELQKEVHKAYCLATYGEENTRKLSKNDREQLELLVKVKQGSSLYETLLQDPIYKILKDACERMSPEQLTAVLIIFGLSATSALMWKFWINKKIRDRELDQMIELSKIEKEKMQVIQEAITHFPMGKIVSDGLDSVRGDLVTKLKDSDELEVTTPMATEQIPASINGELAGKIVKKQRESPVERLIDDKFFLRTADFSRQESVRVELERISDGYSFKADIPLGVLSNDQEEAIKDKSWNRVPITMKVFVKDLNGKYSSAKIMSVELAQNDDSE